MPAHKPEELAVLFAQAVNARRHRAVKTWREAGDLPLPNYLPERIAEFQNRLDYTSVGPAVARRSPRGKKVIKVIQCWRSCGG